MHPTQNSIPKVDEPLPANSGASRTAEQVEQSFLSSGIFEFSNCALEWTIEIASSIFDGA